MSKKTSKRWTDEETRALLRFYTARKNEFRKPRKRRLAFSRVLEDMLSAGFDSNMNVAHLEVKMQTLLRSYKAAKYNQRQCGYLVAPSYFNELQEIFSDKPKNKPVSEVNASTDDYPLSDLLPEGDDSSAEVFAFKTEDTPETSTVDVTSLDIVTLKSEPVEESASRAGSSCSSSSESNAPIKTQKKKMTRSEYYERRLDQREREMKATADRWKQYHEAKEAWRKTKLELLEKVLKK